VVGFPQGGWTALKFSISQPGRVEKLALLSPGGIVPDKLSFVLRALPLSMLGSWGIRRVNRLLLGDQVISTQVEDTLTLLMTHFKPRVAPLPTFTDQQLRRLTMPVLLLMGDRDALRDAHKMITRLQRLVPGLTAAIIPGGGHALMHSAGGILPFLARQPRTYPTGNAGIQLE
jgi:pimeloyl-ACP methyl ester carboxylesterase